MKIKVLTIFGRRRVMHGAKILPGVYASDDPALFGLADELVELGVAVQVADDALTVVIPQEEQVSKPVGLTHDEFERRTGRIAPERPVVDTETSTDTDSEVVEPVEDDKPKRSRK